MTRIHYPTSVLLFNRPDESRRMLESLLRQTRSIPVGSLTFSVDGYRGSRDEALGRPDMTSEVAELVHETFPGAELVVHESNLGIAHHYDILETRSFSHPDASWAFFLEDDFVLAPNYFEAAHSLISSVDRDERVVVVSATGDVLGAKTRGVDSMYPMDHAWAFALRRSHHLERRRHISAYLDLMNGKSYFERDYSAVTAGLAADGILTLGTSQDYVKQAIRVATGRVAVTTGRVHGTYIGVNGEHFTPEIYRKLGYDTQPPVSEHITRFAPCDTAWVGALVEEQRRLVALETLRLAEARKSEELDWAREQTRCIEQMHRREQEILSGQLARLEADLNDAQRRLSAMTHSTSWRLTKPLRNLRRLLPS